MKIKILLLMCILSTIFFVNVVSADIKNIEYQIKITWTPYCEEQHCENVTTNNTNSTEVCYEKCFGTLKLEGVEENNIFVEINTGDDFWIDGASSSRFGYKTADLGNLSDISGIREDLSNLSLMYERLMRCQDALRNLDVNMSNCQLLTGFGTNYTIQSCEVDKEVMQEKLNSQNAQISSKEEEVNKSNNNKWVFGVVGFILGIVAIKFVIPKIQGKDTPRDSSEKQFPPNPGY